jgi:hypothetical protein
MTQPLVVITGASSGLGLALARAFVKEDHALLLLARHMEPLPDLPQDRIAYAKADVADYGAVDLAIRRAEDRFGKAECLVNNAGCADARDFKSVDPASYAHEIDVNLKGVLNCTKVVIGNMSARGSGTINHHQHQLGERSQDCAGGGDLYSDQVRRAGAKRVVARGRRPQRRSRDQCRARLYQDQHSQNDGHSFDEYRQALGKGGGGGCRGHPLLLETAAADLHPRHRGDADPLELLSAVSAGALGWAMSLIEPHDASRFDRFLGSTKHARR